MSYKRYQMEFCTGKHSVNGMGFATAHARAKRELSLAAKEMRRGR